MAEVKWTTQAIKDLEAIVACLAADSQHFAQLFVIDIMEATYFPSSGTAIPEAEDLAVRELMFGNYRIAYRIRPKQIEILAIYQISKLPTSKPAEESMQDTAADFSKPFLNGE